MSQIIHNLNTQSRPVTVTRTRMSKKDRAKELYTKNHELPRDQLIQMFIDELDMPENSARTYVSVCAKELNGTLGKDFKTRKVNRTNLKRDRAFQIYSDNISLPRKEIIEKMCADLGMTVNSAATHCSLAAKHYRSQQGS